MHGYYLVVPNLSVLVILGNHFIFENSRGIDFDLDFLLLKNCENVPLSKFPKNATAVEEKFRHIASRGPRFQPRIVSSKRSIVPPVYQSAVPVTCKV